MANFQLILSDPKTRRSFKTDVNPPASQVLVGHRIGDIIDGSMISLNVKFKITGGSDKSGVP
ncbi:MAG: 30S ribosomal protein S6e, partial [Nitrososphaerota archaeon]|nr:30S ribosomal protein S6e [Nitrososphaerota archaeon]